MCEISGATPPATTVAGAAGGGPATKATTDAAAAAPADTKAGGDAGAGAAALGVGAPGSIAAVLSQLVTTLQSLVAALQGTIGGGGVGPFPPPGGSATSGTTTVSQFATQSMAGRNVTIAKDSEGGYRIVNPTGFDEIVQVDGKMLRFDHDGKSLRHFDVAKRRAAMFDLPVHATPLQTLEGWRNYSLEKTTILREATNEDFAETGVRNQLDESIIAQSEQRAARLTALVEQAKTNPDAALAQARTEGLLSSVLDNDSPPWNGAPITTGANGPLTGPFSTQSMSGSVVTMVKDANGAIRISNPTGKEEIVQVEGRIIRFGADGTAGDEISHGQFRAMFMR